MSLSAFFNNPLYTSLFPSLPFSYLFLGDFRNFTGNYAKLVLSIITIFFDILFMVQHYILFPAKEAYVPLTNEEPSTQSGDERSKLELYRPEATA